MSKEKYNQIINEVYENYSKEYEKDNSIGILMLVKRVDNELVYKKLDKERFTGLCEHDKSFSEKWGLKIEERELSLEEQIDLALEWGHDSFDLDMAMCNSEDGLTEYGIPTRVFTVTYNNETIDVYE